VKIIPGFYRSILVPGGTCAKTPAPASRMASTSPGEGVRSLSASISETHGVKRVNAQHPAVPDPDHIERDLHTKHPHFGVLRFPSSKSMPWSARRSTRPLSPFCCRSGVLASSAETVIPLRDESSISVKPRLGSLQWHRGVHSGHGKDGGRGIA
jgi:hypothetical protein